MVYRILVGSPTFALFCFFFFQYNFYFPASGQAVVTGVVPSGTFLQFYRAEGSAFPTLVDFSSNFLCPLDTVEPFITIRKTSD